MMGERSSSGWTEVDIFQGRNSPPLEAKEVVLRLVPYRGGGPVFPEIALYRDGVITTVADRWLRRYTLAGVSDALLALRPRMEIRTEYSIAERVTRVVLRPIVVSTPQQLDEHPPLPGLDGGPYDT